MSDPASKPIGPESARALLKYAVALLLVSPLLTMWLLGVDRPGLSVDFLGPITMLGLGISSWILLARGQIDLAIACLVYGVGLAVAGIAVFTGGVRSPVIVIYPVLILVYGWLSNSRSAIRLTLLITSLTLGLWAADRQGLLPVGTAVPTSVYLLHVCVIYLMSALLTSFIMAAYQRQMGKLKTLGDELAQYTQLLEQNTQVLERAQSVGKVGSWVSDIAGDGLVRPSVQACRILGLAPGMSLSFNDYLARVHESDRAGVKQAWQQACRGGVFDGEHRLIVAGSVRWVRQRAELEFAADGRPLSALGIVQDISAHKLTQQALHESEVRHRTLIEWTPEAILVHRHTRILYANPAALRLFGAPDLASLQLKATTELIHPDCRSNQLARMHSIENAEPLPPSVESRFLKLDGSVVDVEVQGTAIAFDGAPAVHVSIRDITQRKQLEDEIRQLAFFDALTHLPNRRLLNDRLGQALSANRRSGCFGALMFLDLDNFKPLNDHYGHAVGDRLLEEAAMRLKNCVRDMDTVARFGGDEFVVLLAELDPDWQKSRLLARMVAEKIKAILAMPYLLTAPSPGHPDRHIQHSCSASLGVVVFSSALAQAGDLTKWADAAMYQAKKEGRNRICFSDFGAAASDFKQSAFDSF